MHEFQIGDKLLAYGIISIIANLAFLTWAEFTVPSGDKSIPFTGSKFTDLAAALIMGFEIQAFVDEILLKNITPDKYTQCVLITTIIGIIAYSYISFY